MLSSTCPGARVALGAMALTLSAAGCDLLKTPPTKETPTTSKPAVGGLSDSIKDPKATQGPAGTKMPSRFVRPRPEEGPEGGVDACAYLGWVGAACLSALLEEKDPVKRRYMRRLSDADARLAIENLRTGQPEGVAHAELALFCADSGPCNQKDADGNELDDGYACLTKAEVALQEGDEGAAKKAQSRACKCDPRKAQIPVMGGVLACDGADQPVRRGKDLSLEVAKEIRACGECDGKNGPAACRAEVARLASSNPEIAKYLRGIHAPRCAKP